MSILKSVLMCAGTGVLAKLPDVKNDKNKAHNGSTLFLQVDLDAPTTFECATVKANYGRGYWSTRIKSKTELQAHGTRAQFSADAESITDGLYKFKMADLKPYTTYDVYCVDSSEKLTTWQASTGFPDVKKNSDKSHTASELFLEVDLVDDTPYFVCFTSIDGDTSSYQLHKFGIMAPQKAVAIEKGVHKFALEKLHADTKYKVECFVPGDTAAAAFYFRTAGENREDVEETLLAQ